MRFSNNGAFYRLETTEEEKKIIEKELQALDRIIGTYDLGSVDFDTFKKSIEKIADDLRSDDLGYVLNAYFVGSFFSLIDEYNMLNNKKADKVKEELKLTKSPYKDITNNLVKTVEIIEEKLGIHTDIPVGYIHESDLKDLITSNHTFSEKNRAFKFYVHQEIIDKASYKNRVAFAKYCRDNVHDLLDSEYNDQAPQEVLYNIAINYKSLKQTHDKGLKIFNIFSFRWHKERKALNRMEEYIRESIKNPVLNSNPIRKEEFINYCKTGRNGENLGLVDIDTVVYSPMIVGMVHETLLPKEKFLGESETKDICETKETSDEVKRSKSLTVNELKNSDNFIKNNLDKSFDDSKDLSEEEIITTSKK